MFPLLLLKRPSGWAKTCCLEVTWAGLGQTCQLPSLTWSSCDNHRGTPHSFQESLRDMRARGQGPGPQTLLKVRGGGIAVETMHLVSFRLHSCLVHRRGQGLTMEVYKVTQPSLLFTGLETESCRMIKHKATPG